MFHAGEMRVNPCIGTQLTASAHRQPTYSSHLHHHLHHDDHSHQHNLDDYNDHYLDHHDHSHQHNHDHYLGDHDHDHHAYIFWDDSDPLIGDRNVLHENG